VNYPSASPWQSTPSRDDIVQAMARVQPGVLACPNDWSTPLLVDVWFAHTGHVCGVRVPEALERSPLKACITRAVHAATVPPFSEPYFHVRFPFPYHSHS
jgi:hypothetical protein